jgi:mannose-6-phosphate isomerase-like protein (cupin superfamily)
MHLPVLVPAVGKGVGHMEESPRKMVAGHAVVVPAGGDRFGERRSLGISTIAFKVLPSDRHDHLIVENVFHAVGGPARHLHHHQDEWFYVVEGTFEFEVGSERMQLNPGDSLMAPQGVPHVWAHVGKPLGRVLIEFLPAGRMEAFFREVTRANAMPPLDAALWSAHGMELLGPPLGRLLTAPDPRRRGARRRRRRPRLVRRLRRQRRARGPAACAGAQLRVGEGERRRAAEGEVGRSYLAIPASAWSVR